MSSIILVEDDVDTLRLMVEILEADGYEVRAFVHGDSAWTYIRQHGFDADLLITDLKLPGELDGLQLVHKLHRLLPEVPTVVTSGCHAELSGADNQVYWLRKPYTVEQLEAICQALTTGTSLLLQHS